MTLRRTAAITVVLSAAVFGTVFWEICDLNRLRHIMAERAGRRMAIEARIRAMEKRGTAAHKANSTLSSAIDKLRTAKKISTVGDGSAGFRVTVAKNPELRRLYLKGFIADLYLHWGLLFKQLGLSTDQIDNFTAIQLRLEEAKLALAASAATDGGSSAEPDIVGQLGQADRDANQEIRELLGGANYAAYRSYSQNMSALTLVNDLAGFGSPGTDSLTDLQTQQITQILADASIRTKYGSVIYGTVNWEMAMPQAQAVLTPSQYEAMLLMESEKITQWQQMQSTNK